MNHDTDTKEVIAKLDIATREAEARIAAHLAYTAESKRRLELMESERLRLEEAMKETAKVDKERSAVFARDKLYQEEMRGLQQSQTDSLASIADSLHAIANKMLP